MIIGEDEKFWVSLVDFFIECLNFGINLPPTPLFFNTIQIFKLIIHFIIKSRTFIVIYKVKIPKNLNQLKLNLSFYFAQSFPIDLYLQLLKY